MSKDVAVLGVGMHPWGKWGQSFVGYGVKAAQDALKDAGVEWKDIQLVAGGDTIRNGYPGYVAGATFAQALGWSGAKVSSSYGACATGAQAISVARANILAGLCDVALVIGADAAPKGFFAPTGGGGRRIRTGCASTSKASRIPRISACMRAGAWTFTGRLSKTSLRSKSKTPSTAFTIPMPDTAKRSPSKM